MEYNYRLVYRISLTTDEQAKFPQKVERRDLINAKLAHVETGHSGVG